MYTYIYIDESGNLGMNSQYNYFIISALKFSNDEDLIKSGRILKKIRERKLKKKLKDSSEIKFSNSTKEIRCLILEKLNDLNVEVYTVIIDKRLTNSELKHKLPLLYFYLIKVLLEKTLNNIPNKKLKIILDRCMNKSQRENFENYVNTQFLSLFSKLPEVEIKHKDSQNDFGLQMVDFVSGAFGYKYNTSNLDINCNLYTDFIQKIIKIEKNDLFK